MKVALINRVWTFGSLESALDPPLLTARAITNWGPILEATGRFLKPPDVEATMPDTEPERTMEAIARAGPGTAKTRSIRTTRSLIEKPRSDALARIVSQEPGR